MASVSEITAYLDDLLKTSETPDYPGAINGLQLTTRLDIRRVAAAVDYSGVTVREAVRARVQLMLVHHGMFWGAPMPITGSRYEVLAALIENGISVYSSHLPLDLHPQLGNNVLLAETLGLEPSGGFARFKGLEIGVSGDGKIATADLLD